MAINFNNQGSIWPWLIQALKNQGGNNRTQNTADAINAITG